jgi:oxalate---CoA ligase
MKICVVGAGGIGGLLAARLAHSGHDVTVIARGPHLAAIRANGLKLIEEDGSEKVVQVKATDKIAEAGKQDLVILGMKAQQVAAVVKDLPALYDDKTVVLTAQNGIPWWYFFKNGGPHEGRVLESVDPGGVIAANLPADRVLGSVVYPAAEISEPGVIKHIEGNRFSIAEIDNSKSERAAAVSDALTNAGFKAPVVSDVRAELWTKLWGNLSFNPISALTHATLEDICRFPATRETAARLMREAQAVGEALGIRFRIPLEKRIAGAEAVGAHKTSMLQDIEAGRGVELDALVGSVIELGRVAQVPTPQLDAVYSLVSLLSATLAKEGGRLKIEKTQTIQPKPAAPAAAAADKGVSTVSGAKTLRSLLDTGRDDATAISASGAKPLTYGAFRRLVDETIVSLNRQGIGRGDRVAIVLPNGPEMATAFVAIASAATAAPLNPGYREEEFEFYMTDVRAKALVVEEGSTSPAVAAAQNNGIKIITLKPDPESGSGAFTLSSEGAFTAVGVIGAAEEDDTALILHTSGTTSRPKIVPLSHRNVFTSAGNIAKSLELTDGDRALNIMPLFHIHGLIAGVLAPLSRGGSIFSTPGFNALKFFAAMDEAAPTWYTAVPTMHQAILTRAANNREIIEKHKLRFIRSSSSALPPQVITELEATFGTHVSEAYGMTEAAHQMASNPLGASRRPGTVGRAAGPEVAIMDTDGRILGAGETGEIVIRGDNVTAGYENNEKANGEAFTHGWFRTGDQGTISNDGYISITGRLKEIINRGGEKVSPREVDEVLMDHPAVAQALTFALPHDKLGEDVAAAIVLREGQTATEREIRDFASTRLANFKVPRKIVLLPEIPKGATGKLQRIGLAEKLGLTAEQ